MSSDIVERLREQDAYDEPTLAGVLMHEAADEIERLRAENEALKKDAAVGQAIERAAKELPDGYVIQLEIEKDAGTVCLLLPGTNATIDEFDGDGFVDYINDAIDHAKADAVITGRDATMAQEGGR